MVEEALVDGCGWISDDSSLYGSEQESEQRPTSLRNLKNYLSIRERDLNFIVAQANLSTLPRDLHNIYEGQIDAWQLGESVSDFLQRLPPRTTSLDIGPWLWVANPHPESRADTGRSKVQEELIPRGKDVLDAALRERSIIRAENTKKPPAILNHLLGQEAEKLKTRLEALAAEANVRTGKWMLFPSPTEVDRHWAMVVDGTISGRLGIAAKVATDDGATRDRLICVYTKDFRDSEDVYRVLKELQKQGLVQKGRGIYYKSDVYTYLDIYGKNASSYGLQASVYSSSKMLQSSTAGSTPIAQKSQKTLDSYY